MAHPRWQWISIVLGAALLISAVTLGIRAYGLQNTLPPGMTAGGVQLGGVSFEEAERALIEKGNLVRTRKVVFQSDYPGAGGRAATFESLGLIWDTSAAEAALRQLRTGSPFGRAWWRWKDRNQDFPPVLRYNETHLRTTVKRTWADLLAKEPVPARRVITDRDLVEIIPDVAAFRVNETELLSRLIRLDWAKLWNSNTANNADGTETTVELPVKLLTADVTADGLTRQGIDRKISEFSTVITPGDPGRLHNIASAARTVHDRLLTPDEIFDYAPLVKETESRFGFREAPVILNGKLVPGIGGGICQVSSTLYNAALRAGIDIVERRNHSLPVSYVPLGQDATFSDGYINFRFRNNTGAYLLIRTETAKDRLTVKLFGRLPADISYSIDSVTVQELEIPVKTVINPDLKPGTSETLMNGKPGYVVETYRTKKQDGTILSRELISRDRYSPQPKLMAIWGKSAADKEDPVPGGKPGLLEDGVQGPRFR